MQIFWKWSVLALMVLTMVLLSACGKRRNMVDPPPVAKGEVFVSSHSFPSLENNPLERGVPPVDPRTRHIVVYTPPGYRPYRFGPPYPVLYLLHPFDGDENSFSRAELTRVMDEMIASGEIQPMIVVQTNASTVYGGSFYMNSAGTGNYSTMIFKELIDYIERDPITSYNVIYGRRSRAIGGLGMGGYGALRIALENDSLFSSVSALTGAVAFEGDGAIFKGFIDRPKFIDKMFLENGLLLGISVRPDVGDPFRIFVETPCTTLIRVVPIQSFAQTVADTCIRGTDTTIRINNVPAAGTLIQDSVIQYLHYKKYLKPDSAKPYTRLFFAMAAAFSPRQPGDSDSLYFNITQKPTDPGLTLPVNYLRKVEKPVWDRWMAYDVHTLIINNPNKLDTLPVYLDAAANDDFSFNLQVEALDKTIRTLRVYHPLYDYSFETYSGYSDLPARQQTFLYDRLRKVLKFHSDRLQGLPPD